MIGGNKKAQIQIKTEGEKNEIGEMKTVWLNKDILTGFLDLSGGDSKYTTYNSKIQESTHIFICDYVDLQSASAENARLLIDEKVYDIMLIDNPMELNKQLEIYLKYTGGQNV